jgi:hypothetical protein
MLEIKKGDKVHLPKKHHEAHNICAHLYDLLTEIFHLELYSNLRLTNISLEENSILSQAFSNDKDHVLDILKSHNRNAELEDVLTKHITLSVLSDMLNFIYEAINIAKKGKMSVAYSLLRKPFTDELLILEQILIDKKDFIKRFFHDGEISSYDPSNPKLDKLKIIQSSIKNLNVNLMFNADLIYKLRYDKNTDAGINGLTNKALHIITNRTGYPTEKQNLNFVFSNQEDTKSQWDHFYFAVPLLLMYTTMVVDKIIFEYVEDENKRLVFKNIKRLIASIMLYGKSKNLKSGNLYKTIGKSLATKCHICCNENKFIGADFKLFFYEDIFLCSKCFNPIHFNSETLENFQNALTTSNKFSN